MPLETSLPLLQLLRSRRFLFLCLAQSFTSLVLACLPLTHILGFEYCLLMGFLSTVFISHFSLASIRALQGNKSTLFSSTILKILIASSLSLVPALSIISLNALRVRNCNFYAGLLFFFMYVFLGIFWGTSIGAMFAMTKRRKLANVFIYLLPLLNIGWVVWYGLQQPPIYAYSPYFTFYPGTIYDELREITTTLLIYKGLTLTLAFLFLSFLFLFAGKSGVFGKTFFSWKTSSLFSETTSFENKLAGLCCFVLFSVITVWGQINASNIGFRHNRASIAKALGGKKVTKHFIIYFDEDAFTPRQVKQMARDHEFRYRQLADFFQLEIKRKIRSFVFRSPEQKNKYMGAARTMIARPWAYEIYIHGKSFPHPVLKHELTHVFSAEFGVGPLKMSVSYGIFFHAAMVEGVAVAADGSRGGLSPHQWCKAMIKFKYKPRPSKILSPTGFFSKSSLMAYKIAGSFSRFLIDTYGIEKYKRVYGPANFQEIYKKSLPVLEKEWLNFLKKKITLNRYDQMYAKNRFKRYRSIFVRACPHEVAALRKKKATMTSKRKYKKAIRIQKRLCQIAPKPHNFISLANLHGREENYPKAIEILQGLLSKTAAVKNPLTRINIQRNLASIYGMTEKQAQAQGLLWKLQKQPMSLRRRRSLWLRLQAMKQEKSIRNLILHYLGKSERKLTYQVLIHSFQTKASPLLQYLAARRFYYAADYRRSIRLLDQVLQAFPMPNIPPTSFEKLGQYALSVESERLQAMSYYFLGDLKKAKKLFAQRSRRALSSGELRLAKDWLQRCSWEQKQYPKRNKTVIFPTMTKSGIPKETKKKMETDNAK